MSFLGNTPTTQSFTSLTERFNGNGSATTITLSREVYNASDIEVLVNNVQQDPYDAYTVNGTTTLTFTEAPSSGTGNIIVTYRNYTISKFIPGEGTVTVSSIVDGTITGAKIASATITGDKIGLTAITSNLIAANAITTAAIADGSINTSELASAAVTGDKIGLTAINANNIVNSSITGNKIGLTAITSNLIASAITLTNVSVASVSTFLGQIVERANVTTAMSATLTVPSTDTGVIVFTANSSANATINFTGLGSLPVGNLASYVIMVPNSSTAKYISTYQIDGAGVTVKWAGGVPIGGTSANTDIYSFNIVKTAATPTYNVFASVQSYF
jgi:hypothetical protein